MKKVLGGIVIALFVIIAGAYLAGRYYFAEHFYPKTTMNGINVSLKTSSEALDLLNKDLGSYVLRIKSDDGTLTISAAQCDLKYTNTTEVSDVLTKQNETYWFKEILSTHKYTSMGETLDEAKLKEAVNNLACMNPKNPQKPVNASIKYDDTKKEYVIVDEVIGNIVEPDSLYEGVKKAVLAGDDILDLSTQEYYKQPKYHATDDVVVKAKATLDKYMSTVINYEDLGNTYTLNSENIHKFLKVSKDFKITFDEAVMKKFISDNIAPLFTTVGKKRTITSPGSGTFTVKGGTYGWQVGLIAERTAMIKDIKNGKEVTREPEYLQDAAVKDTENDIGDTYVDVSISDQHLWVIKDGKVKMQSDFVSGNESAGHGTTKGIFMVENKVRHYRMENFNVTVSYWMPFDLDLGEGFHDASWRKSFGGSIYLSDGSHGCINLPPKFAKKLYNFITVRYPVIVH